MPTSSPDGIESDGYSYHWQEPEDGEQEYVRCEYCGEEQLTALGGMDGILHQDGCPQIGKVEHDNT